MAIRIKIVSDLDEKGLKEAQLGLQKLGDIADRSFKFLAAGAGLAAVGIAKFANDSIRQASNLAESTNAVNVAFGKSAEAILAIGKNSAESLGLARNEFNEAAVRFSAFAERISGVGADTSGFIQEITTRAADFASVFNIEVAEALRVFQSGLAGEAEPLKRFGINLLESEVKAYALRAGIISVGESMDETQKVQARYGLLLESTAKTAGDFANTSEGLANSQRILKARFTDLQAELGNALLPAFTELVKQIANALMPRLEELGQFLNSPQGKKAIQETADAVVAFGTALINNIDTIIKTGGFLLAMSGSIVAVKNALVVARTAQLLFNLAVSANPYVMAVSALVALVTSVTAFAAASKDAKDGADVSNKSVAELNDELEKLRQAHEDGLISTNGFIKKQQQLETQLAIVTGRSRGAVGELNRFQNINMDRAAESMLRFKNATEFATRQAKSFNDSYSYLESIGAVTRRAGAASADAASAIASTGPSAFEQAREKVQDLIRSSQKQLADAQKTLVNAQVNARQNYAENILRIEKDFAAKLSNIIQQSQDRLRSAYRTAVEENIAALFDRSEDKSVEGLVKSLSDKLNASRRLLENSAQLASQGFSQTFIEQVVSAGTETGNELAQAILNSTPETRAELQSLFSAIEREASTGMDSLSQEIFDKQGLATQELKNLYVATQGELNLALVEQQTILENSLTAANDAFVESVKKIKSNLSEQLADMKGQFGGMERVIDQFIGKLDQLIAKSAQVAAITNAPAPSIPAPVSAPAISYQPIPTPVAAKPVAQTQPVVNINVKTDTAQSNAMVGKAIAKEVNKYTGGGGGLRGVKVVAL